MRIAATVVSAITLVLYGLLAYRSPLYGLFEPRGGALALGVSLALAAAAISIAGQSQRPLSQRFQIQVAAWIWLLVQSGGILYLLYADGA